MDLFVIGCTTCRQRLKVRDLALVGQIQPCPNCGSMVHIQPPPDWKPPADGPAAAASNSAASPSEPRPATPANDAVPGSGAVPSQGAAPSNGTAPANGAATTRPASPGRQGAGFVPPTAKPAGLPTGKPDDPSLRETAFDNDFGDIEKLLEPGSDKKRPGSPPGGTSNQITRSAIDGFTPPSNGKPTVIINRDLAGPANGGAAKGDAAKGDAGKAAGKAKGAPAFPAANDDGELAIPASAGSGSGSFAGGLPGPDSDSATSGLSGSFSLGLPVVAPEKGVRRPLLLTGIVIATALGIAVTVLVAVFAKPWLRRSPTRVVTVPNASGTPVVDLTKGSTSPVEKTSQETPDKSVSPPVVPTETSTSETPANTSPNEVETPNESTDETTSASPDAETHDPLNLLDDPKNEDKGKATPSTDSAMASKLNSFISDSSFDDTPKADLAKIDAEPESPGDGVSRPRPPMKPIDLKARLADKIEGIDIPGVRIDAFINMMADLSTIPISLDPEGLLAVGKTPQTPVQGKYLKVNVEGALRETLDKQQLDLVTQDATLVVVAARKQRSQVYKVSDLASNEAELNDLVTLVDRILVARAAPAAADKELSEKVSGEAEADETTSAGDEAPPSEEPAEVSTPTAIRADKGQLVADLDELGHFHVRRILDAIRAARGLTVRENVPEASVKPQGYEASCGVALGAPLKLNFSHGELAREILAKFAEESKCQILIDWAALAEAGWPKEADATLVVANKPLASALDDLLKPMDLTCVPVGPGWLQVTSPQAMSRHIALDFYPIGDLAKSSEEGAQWIASLSSELSGEQRSFAFDPASGLLIAKLSMADHLAIRKAIESRRREIGAAAR